MADRPSALPVAELALALGHLQALREEIARLQDRVATLEEQGRSHASRRICALMTEITTLETDILRRDVTTSDLKKAGMRSMGMEK